jgi:hypothetical protein
VTGTDTHTHRADQVDAAAENAGASGRRDFNESRTQAAKYDEVDVVSLLDEFTAGDPAPDQSARSNGRLYLVAHPVGTAADALAEVSTNSAGGDLDTAVRRAVTAREERVEPLDMAALGVLVR